MEIDALQFPFGSALMRDLYREINDNRNCLPSLDRYLATLGHQKPNIRILEVGAGTGGTAPKLLRPLSTDKDGEQCIARYSSYDYTDISQSFSNRPGPISSATQSLILRL